jgi:hypothetical protein
LWPVSSAAAMTVGQQSGPAIRRLAQLGLMPAGALAVHQLRFWLAFGSRADVVLRAQGHAYLHSVAPWVVLLIAISAGMFLRALGHALGGRCSLSRVTISFLGLWLLCALSLVAIYVAQECLEGVLATGHPAGMIGIFGYGGWWSIPAALAVGLVLAAFFHGATWIIREVAARCRPEMPGRAPRTPLTLPPRDRFVPSPVPLAGGWSGRGPPV